MKKLMITVNGKRYEVDVEVVQDDEADMVAVAPRPARTIDSYVTPPSALPSSARRAPDAPEKGNFTCPVNGVVLEVQVSEGQTVQKGDVLFVLEAMKMKTTISSSDAGLVKTIHVKVGERVEAGQVLLTFA